MPKTGTVALCLSLFTATVSFLSSGFLLAGAFFWQPLSLPQPFLCRCLFRSCFFLGRRFFGSSLFLGRCLFLDGGAFFFGWGCSLFARRRSSLCFIRTFSLRGIPGWLGRYRRLIRNWSAEAGASSAETGACDASVTSAAVVSSTSTNSLSPPAGPWLFVPSIQASATADA